jgi:Flp pilus assembly CpaF family ATPase
VILEVSGRFREASKKGEFSDRQSAKEALDAILLQICRDSGLLMETDQFDYLSKIAFMHIWGYGPLDPLLADDRLEEIAVIGLKKPVYVYKRGEGWLSTDCVFTEQEAFVNLVNKMARPLGRRLTHQTPRLNAVLPDGSRIHASMPPLSQLELTVRKFRANPISVPDLVNFRTFSPEALAFLWLAMKTDTSIIVAGNTASGKTSTLNALFSFVPLDERVLITEETPEINIPHKHKIGLLASPELGIGMCELASDSLRMRPDRVIVGEVRTKDETKALLEAITSGQARGSYATFHAHSADEAIARMRSLGVLETDIASIGLIVVQKRIAGSGKAKEIRLVTEISELKIEAGSAKAVQLYVYDYESKSLKRTAAHDSETEREIRRAFGLSESGFKRELADRSKLLSSLAKKKRSFFETVVSIQTYERRKEDEN